MKSLLKRRNFSVLNIVKIPKIIHKTISYAFCVWTWKITKEIFCHIIYINGMSEEG